MTPNPLLSLAMIVRDEAAALPRFFAAHRGLWDEAVVVDTGSRDGTPAVAAGLGARVADFAWCDDFAAARNAALALCRGVWVVVLDTDEQVAPADQGALREYLGDAAPAGLSLPQWNYTDDVTLPGWVPVAAASAAESGGAAGYVVARQVRVFPADPAVRYRGRVHESVEADLLARGWPVMPLGWPIHHHGHRAAADTARRCERDGRLLRAKLAEQPLDPRTRYEMAAQLLRERQPELARRLLERLVAEAPDGPRAAESWRLLARLAAGSGSVQAARGAARRAVSVRPDDADGWADLVQVLWSTDDRAGAVEVLGRFMRLFPRDPRLPTLIAQVQQKTADTTSSQRGEA